MEKSLKFSSFYLFFIHSNSIVVFVRKTFFIKKHIPQTFFHFSLLLQRNRAFLQEKANKNERDPAVQNTAGSLPTFKLKQTVSKESVHFNLPQEVGEIPSCTGLLNSIHVQVIGVVSPYILTLIQRQLNSQLHSIIQHIAYQSFTCFQVRGLYNLCQHTVQLLVGDAITVLTTSGGELLSPVAVPVWR